MSQPGGIMYDNVTDTNPSIQLLFTEDQGERRPVRFYAALALRSKERRWKKESPVLELVYFRNEF